MEWNGKMEKKNNFVMPKLPYDPCCLQLLLLGPVSQTGLRLSQEMCLEKNITGVYLETKQKHWYVLRSVSGSFFYLKQLRLTL